ncbi:MAG: DUF2232 domain-containing protein [Gemmatimonadetes bacterium]|nr:DUF2232 domain-containing protein [Gemmatimonadota bacterium]
MLGSIGYAVWAPLPLAGLPFAALVIASRPRARAPWSVALIAGALSVGALVAARGMVGAFVAAFVVLVTAAFTGGALLAPATVLRQALRATALAGVAVIGLARLVWGPTWWDGLQWQAAREASRAVRPLVAVLPEAAAVADRAIAFTSATIPGMLALQAIAGLALAWQWHVHVSDQPLGEGIAPFRQFRFGDQWVWGLVAAVTIWAVPKLAGLKAIALNLAVVLGALYLLRGAAIVTVFAAAVGVSPAALVAGAVLAAVLAVPLLFLIPGLWTLGVTDTWLEFRRRLEERNRPHAT